MSVSSKFLQLSDLPSTKRHCAHLHCSKTIHTDNDGVALRPFSEFHCSMFLVSGVVALSEFHCSMICFHSAGFLDHARLSLSKSCLRQQVHIYANQTGNQQLSFTFLHVVLCGCVCDGTRTHRETAHACQSISLGRAVAAFGGVHFV